MREKNDILKSNRLFRVSFRLRGGAAAGEPPGDGRGTGTYREGRGADRPSHPRRPRHGGPGASGPTGAATPRSSPARPGGERRGRGGARASGGAQGAAGPRGRGARGGGGAAARRAPHRSLTDPPPGPSQIPLRPLGGSLTDPWRYRVLIGDSGAESLGSPPWPDLGVPRPAWSLRAPPRLGLEPRLVLQGSSGPFGVPSDAALSSQDSPK